LYRLCYCNLVRNTNPSLPVQGYLSFALYLTYQPTVCHSPPLWPARSGCLFFLSHPRPTIFGKVTGFYLHAHHHRCARCPPCVPIFYLRALRVHYLLFSQAATLLGQRSLTFFGTQPVTPVSLTNPLRGTVFGSARPLQQLLPACQIG